jgi:cytochrome c oxidase subunit III
MTTIDPQTADRPYHETSRHAEHFRSNADEFDACKIGMWLFLATEILLFGGLFCAYGVFRMLYPEAFAQGSHSLDWRLGGFNTVVLLVSSFTIAKAIQDAQRNRQGWLQINLALTMLAGVAFLVIKFVFEYGPKWAEGKRPGALFDDAFAVSPYEPIWWSLYYVATGIHATHVLIGVLVIGWLWWRARKRHFGPTHYNAVEITGLYWHVVDIIWIFLFPLLYLIH